MALTARKCGWCGKKASEQFYQGRRQLRCDSCSTDYRTPLEARRDAVLDRYGDNPEAYTPAVLKELAEQGLFDLTGAFCPAGRLSMEETKAREARGLSK